MSDLLLALGLVLALEGTLYALAPSSMLSAIRRMLEMPPETLRLAGVAALAVGVGIVWLVRSG
ncbi:MAG: DUF2065 domain-containing protein [Acuticoccus sp.]